MKKIVISWLAVLVFWSTHAAENTKYDFSTMPEGVVIGRNCAVENGVLVVRHSPENTFPISTTEAIKLSFQLKVRRLLPGKSRNLGINLYSKNGEYGFFFVSENEGVVGHWNVIENGTVRRKNGAWSSRDIKVIPKEGQTMKFELFVRSSVISVNIDGKNCLNARFSLLPLDHLSFTSYNYEYEVDDLTIETVKEEKKDEITSPVFSADFNQNTTAVDDKGKAILPEQSSSVSFVPGVEGTAVQVKAANTKLLKYRPALWFVTEDGRLETKSFGLPGAELEVPSLKDFNISVKMRRLGEVPAKGKFCSFQLTADDDRLLTISNNREKIWEVKTLDDKYFPRQIEQLGADFQDEAMLTYTFEQKAGVLTCAVNGQEFYSGPGVDALKKFTIISYGVKITIDDLAITGNDFNYQESFESTGPGKLVYLLNDALRDSGGGIMFWVSNENGNGGEILRFLQNDQTRITAAMNGGSLAVQVSRKDTERPLLYNRSLPGSSQDWFLVALSWDQDNVARFFINMFPYVVDFKPGQRCPDFINADINGINRLEIAPEGGFAIDRLRLFRRPLQNHDVEEEFRRVMPVDLVMERSLIEAGEPTALRVQAAPGGFYTRPAPVERDAAISASIQVEFELKGGDGKSWLKENRELNVTAPMDIELSPVSLPLGRYELVATVRQQERCYRRTFIVKTALPTVMQPEAVDEELRIGRLLFSRKLTDAAAGDLLAEGNVTVSPAGTYLEAGAEKGNRFSFEVAFPVEVLGKPVVLEIVWPDDKARSMGWYMYSPQVTTVRDRLQSGVQAGRELPNSGRLITTRHIFYPGFETYLFEARTMIPGMPAAVAELRVYEIVGDLPHLKIRTPAGMPGRRFGHLDEDQTFNNNLNVDIMSERSPVHKLYSERYRSQSAFVTDETIRYFGYTGMNAIHYPIWRYFSGSTTVEGHTGNGLFPYESGDLPLILDRLAAAGIDFVSTLQYENLPEIALLDKIESNYVREGLVSKDRYGEMDSKHVQSGCSYVNPSHQKVPELLARHVVEPARIYSACSSYRGIGWWGGLLGWRGIDWGYDDDTVGRFSQTTGIAVPQTYSERYSFLTGEKRREWLQWRADQITTLVRSLRGKLNAVSPELELTLNLPHDKDLFEKRGIDLEALRQIPGVQLALFRTPTAYRHDFHWGKPESTSREELYNPDPELWKSWLTDGGINKVFSFNTYFEMYAQPLNSSRYPNLFQSADVKPHGRYYLQEHAFAVGCFDTLEFVQGGQPLATIGREKEAREFARAFCALPARRFQTVPGLKDPAIARFLDTPNGTYFYIVNMFHDPVTVRISLEEENAYTDLSTGKSMNETLITLKPFQLRSFLFPDRKVTIRSLALENIRPESMEFYRKRLIQLHQALEVLTNHGIETEEEKTVIGLLETHLDRQEMAEVYRLAFSRSMNQLLKRSGEVRNLVQKKQMTARFEYAVNCGGTEFYQAPNGKVFFPDQPFDGQYGYFGRYQSTARNVSSATQTDMPELFRSEAYDIDGYRFQVAAGKYRLRLYFKIGFKPDARKDYFVFDVLVNKQEMLKNLDLFEACGNSFDRICIQEIGPIEMESGTLELAFRNDRSRYSTVRLLNAVEVIPEP